MKKSHEEERHRWTNREKKMVKIETKQKEIEHKFKQAKSEEAGFRYKIKELDTDIVKKDHTIVGLEAKISKRNDYYEINEYIIHVNLIIFHHFNRLSRKRLQI